MKRKNQKTRKAQAQALIRLDQYNEIADAAGIKLNIEESSVEVENEGDSTTVRLNGPIDSFWGVDTADIIRQLDKDKPKKVNLLISSPGGFVDEAMTLYSDLRARARDGVEIRTEARGFVASAAVLPFLAGDERVVMIESQLMVHDPFAFMFFVGTAEELEKDASKMANALRKVKSQITDIYAQRAGMTKDEADKAMADETFYNGEEISDAGYATEFVEDSGDSNVVNLDEARQRTLAIFNQYRSQEVS